MDGASVVRLSTEAGLNIGPAFPWDSGSDFFFFFKYLMCQFSAETKEAELCVSDWPANKGLAQKISHSGFLF